MSLINQVLQDLDRRHAGGPVMPTAVKAMATPAAPARSWRLAVITGAVLLVAGGSAALAWSMASRLAQPAAPAAAPVAAATAAPAPTPVVVVAASAPAAAASSSASERVRPVAPPVVAMVTPNTKPALKAEAESAPEREDRTAKPAQAEAAETQGTALALAPTSSVKPSAPAAMMAEPRIEKRASTRTAHERAEAEYQRGVTLHQAGQYAEAAQAYAAALREEPTHLLSRQALAGALINQGKSDDARGVLAEGLALAPGNAALAMMLARVHAERGEMQRAAEVLQPTDGAWMSAEDHAFRAAVLQRAGRHAQASDHFAAAVRTMPNNGVWWMGLGISQAAEGKADNAREAFSRARSSGSLTPELAQYVEQRLRSL
ncbi:tetratricopeptide repeat protein [Piscinibacter terrae]|uniref:Tetratricopeptide repeat protein n=1 Tax=Piscinibacter terrae TaxID=2496871 RepID=A0A3N7HSQ6_9BURK|nr:tetratricopeptide repeat protein [Albitalea terrae]RQP25327.1 tetratricopeptide repeat protein [Albitalea terrae]